MSEITANNLEQLRAAHHLRALTQEEEGTAVDRLPNGIYGYAYAPAEAAIPLFAKKSWHSFEMHKRPDASLHLLGFVTAKEAEQLRQSSPGEAVVFPDPWENSTELVSVPMARIIPSKKGPSRENGNGLRVALL
jgi:hypothetical protein